MTKVLKYFRCDFLFPRWSEELRPDEETTWALNVTFSDNIEAIKKVKI